MTVRSMPSRETIGGADEPMPAVWSPAGFADACEQIVAKMRGHAAHHALDLLTNEILSSLGFSHGIEIFERAVSHWHSEADVYPHQGPCPDCERKVEPYRLSLTGYGTEQEIADAVEIERQRREG